MYFYMTLESIKLVGHADSDRNRVPKLYPTKAKALVLNLVRTPGTKSNRGARGETIIRFLK